MKKRIICTILTIIAILLSITPSYMAAMADTESIPAEPEGELEIIWVEVPWFCPTLGEWIIVVIPFPVYIEP